MATHEEYVTYAQARKLKDLGFDWMCRRVYTFDEEESLVYEANNLWENNARLGNNEYAASTQAAVCRWLREQIGSSIIILPAGNAHQYKAEVCNTWHMEWDCIPVEGQFESYEEATSAAIDYVLEIMKGDDK